MNFKKTKLSLKPMRETKPSGGGIPWCDWKMDSVWHGRTFRRSQYGLKAFSVAGLQHRLVTAQSPAFAPGSTLQLIPDPNNEYDPNAVAVYDASGRLHVGFVPRDETMSIHKRLGRGEQFHCLSMWENIVDEKRVALRVLLIDAQTRIRLLGVPILLPPGQRRPTGAKAMTTPGSWRGNAWIWLLVLVILVVWWFR